MAKLIDETGNKYGEWTILEYIPAEKRASKDLAWLAQCSCGNVRPIRISDLRNGKSKSCGCLRHKERNIEINKTYGQLTVLYQLKNRHGNYIQQYHCICSCGNEIDLPAKSINKKKNCGCEYGKGFDKIQEMIGEKYGYLTVLKVSDRLDKKGKRNYRICQCDCGNIVEVYRGHLKDGHTRSCGCMESFGEEYAAQYLTKKNYLIKRQYKLEDLKDKNNLPFDIAIFNSKNKLIGLIEVQGKQHFDNKLLFYSDVLIKHDKMKQEYCLKNKIPLLLLDYRHGQEKTNFSEWNNLIDKFLEENDGVYRE